MKYLVTGGAGFIGRWVVGQLLRSPQDSVVVIDDYSNSRRENLQEFLGHPSLVLVEGSVADGAALDRLWTAHGPFDTIFHLAASIRVQDSIDEPRTTFQNDVVGTFEVLERARRQYFEQNSLAREGPFHLSEVSGRLRVRTPRFVFMSTCMVYGAATNGSGIGENHSTRPSSPYGASKVAAENLVLSYYLSYGLPVKIVRPFNTYGPFQKRNLEGGVVAIFIARDLNGEPLQVKGDGTQTRDLLYVEDCARFVVEAGLTDKGDGEIMNAGSGHEISIRDLAVLVSSPAKGGRGVKIQLVPHDHPQAEISRLLCDFSKAQTVLGWRPRISLEEGIRRTRDWIRENKGSL